MLSADDIEPLTFITASQLAELGVGLTLAELHDVISTAWNDIRSGVSYGEKAVLSLPEDDFWEESGFAPLKQQFSDERLGWKLSSLYSVNQRYGGVKIIGANAFNRRLGLPRSASTFVLMEKFSLRPIAVLEATDLSAARTGTYASEVFRRFLSDTKGISVFIFGTGPIAECVVASLSHSVADSIGAIFVRGRTPESSETFARRLGGMTKVPVHSTDSNSNLRQCLFVITCTNSRYPVFEDDEINPVAVSLHLGGDEVPAAYLQRVLRSGYLACDDIRLVSRRNSQSLSLHFSRCGLSLETVGPLLGVGELSSPDIWTVRPRMPVSITCVGLPMLDLYAAAATYEKYLKLTKPR